MPLTRKQSNQYNYNKGQQALKEKVSYNRKAMRDEKNTNTDTSGYKADQRARQTQSVQEARQNSSSSYPGRNRDHIKEALDNGPKQGRQITEAVKSVGRKVDSGLNKAAQSVSRTRGGKYYSNPTASGDGQGGGKMDREWKNHKWVSRERNANGKWIYDYGDNGGTASSQQNARDRKASQQKAKSKLNLKETQSRSGSRNTGRNQMQRVMDRVDHDTRPVRQAMSNAAKSVSDGASFVSNAVSSALANTPLKDLFK